MVATTKKRAGALSKSELAHAIQFTNVKPSATRNEIVAHLEQSSAYGFNAAMIAMCWVPLARDILQGTGVKVATCIGLGMGHESLGGKVALIKECLDLGADEIDYEPNMGFFLSRMYQEFYNEASALVTAAQGRPIKTMLELGYLKSAEDVQLAARILDEAGVPWIKNSSGVGPGSVAATPEDISLLRRSISSRMRVKASGKIASYETAVALLDAGAELLGTSAGPQIIERVQGGSVEY